MTRSRSLVSVLTALLVASTALAQPSRPLSPPGVAATQVGGKWSEPDKDGQRRYTGGKWIEVSYARPTLRGRTNIFGAGADYGKAVSDGGAVWRAGANATTTLKTEVPLEIGGKRLEPGEYSLFVDLKEPAWTLVLSKQPRQEKYDPNEKVKTWGAYNYDAKHDVVRVPMQMAKPAFSVDQFTVAFVDVTDQGGKLAMVWEKTGGVVPFKVVS
ncbi:MAG TPA: DUF2911 domain-containing protein [Thermoanaerobaculia bacterium]|nr:DUF2911 domain-containing protein [Thermoanaerobaculia bacterium]